MDEDSYEKLMSFAKPVLEAQTRAVMNMGAFQCMKCHTEFAHEGTGKPSSLRGR